MEILQTLAAVYIYIYIYISASRLSKLKSNHLSNLPVFCQVFWLTPKREVLDHD